MSKGYAVKKSANKSSFYKVVPSDNVKIDPKFLWEPSYYEANFTSNAYGFQIFETGIIRLKMDVQCIKMGSTSAGGISIATSVNNSNLFNKSGNIASSVIVPVVMEIPVKFGDYVIIHVIFALNDKYNPTHYRFNNLKICYNKVLHEEV